MKIKILSASLVILLLVSLFTFDVFASQAIRVYLNDEEIQFDVEPMIVNGRTMVPMRAIFEKLGAIVTWDEVTNTAHAYNYDKKQGVSIAIGTMHMLDIYMNIIPLDVPAFVQSGRTLVPLRAVSEAFNCDVQWDGNNRIVNIYSDNYINDLQSEEKNNSGAKVLTIATNATFPPFEFQMFGEVIGIDIDIASAIAYELGYNLEIIDMEFDAIIPSICKGETDFGIAAMTATEDRKKFVNVTNPYCVNKQVIIVSKDSEIQDDYDLYGKIIGTREHTTADIYSKDDYGEENVVSFANVEDAILALKCGSVDAVIVDDKIAKNLLLQYDDLKILEKAYSIEEYVIMISKDNSELLDKVNMTIEKLTVDGTIAAIIEKYESN